jgi:hypothetical protein
VVVALIREMRRRPTQLVTYTEHDEGAADEQRDITIRELAQ